MLRFVIPFVLLTGFLPINAFGQTRSFSAERQDLPLVFSQLESQYQVQCSYMIENTKGVWITIPPGDYSKTEILDAISKQSGLKYRIFDHDHIVWYKDFSQEETHTVCGYIKDGVSKRPLALANVYTDDYQVVTSSDDEGYFELDVNPEAEAVEVSYLGYTRIRIPKSGFNSDQCKDVFLNPSEIRLPAISLTEYLADGLNQSPGANTLTVRPDELAVLPGSVDGDVLSAIQFIPGIQSPSESFGDIQIRGGTADQNLFLWDGIPIFHTGHFFGNISAFNPFIIDKVDVYRSDISSKFGGRVSGVISITSRDSIPQKFSFNTGTNMTHAFLDAEIPLWKGSGLILSGRRSITEVWNTPTFLSYAEKVFQGTKIEDANFNDPNFDVRDEFKFNDGSFKWMVDFGKNRISFSTFGGVNNLSYTSDIRNFNAFTLDVLDLNNKGGILQWNRQWSPKYRSELSLSNASFDSNYDLSIRLRNSEAEVPYYIQSSNYIIDAEFKFLNHIKFNEKQSVQFGFQFTEDRIDINFERKEQSEVSTQNNRYVNGLNALFGEYKLTLPELLNLDIGLRYQYQDVIGKNYFEPRIALTTFLSDYVKLKFSTSKQFQFISQLVVFDINDLGLNNQLWVAADDQTIPVIESNQWMGGIQVKRHGWTFDIETYVRELVGITSLSNTFGELPNQPYSVGNSRIRGIDVLAKKKIRNYDTWISYTLSEALYEFANISTSSFAASNDQRHVIQWVNVFKRGKMQYSVGLTLKSGLPYTRAVGIEYRNPEGEGTPYIVYEAVNSSRLDAYSKLDASVSYRFGLPNRWHGRLTFSLQNITNRKNILAREYFLSTKADGESPDLLFVDRYGLRFTPNLSVNISFR